MQAQRQISHDFKKTPFLGSDDTKHAHTIPAMASNDARGPDTPARGRIGTVTDQADPRDAVPDQPSEMGGPLSPAEGIRARSN